jgi:hypothetical protein
VAGCCECGDEPSGSRATELVSFRLIIKQEVMGRTNMPTFPT